MSPNTLYRTIAVLLLAGIAVERLLASRVSPHVQAYHTKIREAAAQLPTHIGPWVGKDIPVLARAVKLLAPNVMISRRYGNVENGGSSGMLVVHCADAHDMVGHFPLRCYPADGWNWQSSRELHWQLGNREITAMEYTLVLPPASTNETKHTIAITNFLLRPNGQVLRDMDALSESIIGAHGQASGAGQVQVYFLDSTLSPSQREAIVRELVEGYRPLIDAILADIPS